MVARVSNFEFLKASVIPKVRRGILLSHICPVAQIWDSADNGVKVSTQELKESY